MKLRTIAIRAGALVQWLWEETYVPNVVSSNPSIVYWMDIFSHLFVVKIVLVCLKNTETKQKEAEVGPFLTKVLIGQWLWLNWHSSHFRYQRSTVRIQSFEKF